MPRRCCSCIAKRSGVRRGLLSGANWLFATGFADDPSLTASASRRVDQPPDLIREEPRQFFVAVARSKAKRQSFTALWQRSGREFATNHVNPRQNRLLASYLEVHTSPARLSRSPRAVCCATVLASIPLRNRRSHPFPLAAHFQFERLARLVWLTGRWPIKQFQGRWLARLAQFDPGNEKFARRNSGGCWNRSLADTKWCRSGGINTRPV